MPNPFQKKTAWAGADLQDSKPSKCKRCGSPVLLALVKTPPIGTLRWKNFGCQATERNGMLVFLLHSCPR